METYLNGAFEAQTFPLSAFDLQGSFSNIPYAFFYENRDNKNDFMPASLLKESLAKTLELFPHLVGHLRSTARGKIQIELDPQRLNVPEFLETVDINQTFADIKKANFSWASWPENVATVKAFATPDAAGEIKLLNVHVVRLKGNSGVIIFINCPHYCFDGAGYFAFIKQWASCMGALDRAEKPSAITNYCHDRAQIQGHLSEERRPLDPVSDAMYTTGNFFCDSLAWLSPTMLGRLLGKLDGLSPGQGHLFHIPQAKMDELRESLRAHVPEGSRISENDLLVALVSRTYVQSQAQPVPKAGWFTAAPEPESHFTVRIPCDARPRLGIKGTYTGNLLIPMLVREPMEELRRETSPQTLARSALQVRRIIGNVTAPLISQFYGTVSSHPTSYMRPLAFAASHTTTSMVTTSQVKFGLYDADFGAGRPEFVCLTPLFAGSYTIAAFLPPPPGVDGIYVLMTTNNDAMGRVVENEAWKAIANLVW
jgi:hypothetical protein